MKKNRISEATTSGGSGKYKVPLNLAPKIWKNGNLHPFDIPVSDYINSDNAYDSYDGEMERSPKEIRSLENKAKKMARTAERMFSQNDEDGNPFNGYSPGGNQTSGTPDYIEKIANLPKSDFKNNLVKEDLGVWFGTKKKPKGSKQPKGPWVNICRNKEGGGHPPCGRPEATDKGYPKCRAAGVAARMSDSEKRSACQQKRRAEKTNPKSGTGNKPKLTHYEPRNESLRDLIKKIIKESIR
jgi:hypothetical protein